MHVLRQANYEVRPELLSKGFPSMRDIRGEPCFFGFAVNTCRVFLSSTTFLVTMRPKRRSSSDDKHEEEIYLMST